MRFLFGERCSISELFSSLPGCVLCVPPVRDRVAGGAEDLVPRHYPGRNDEVLLAPVRRGPKPVLRAPLDARHLGRLHRAHALLTLLEQRFIVDLLAHRPVSSF